MIDLPMLKMRSFFTIMAIATVGLLANGAAMAAPGDLDASFGTGGIVKTDIDGAPATSDRGTGVAIDGNGKIVVCARVINAGNDTDFGVMRVNTNGTLDTSFDGDGIVITDVNGAGLEDRANAVAINKNSGQDYFGEIVVVGTIDQDAVDSNGAVVIYSSNGTVEAQRIFDFSSSSDTEEEIFAVAIQPDSKIVIAGRTGSDFFLARLLPRDLDLDDTFGTDGMVTATFSAGEDIARAVIIQPSDWKILAVGIDGTNGDFALLRLTSAGVPDTTFDTDGKMTVSFGTGDGAYAVDIDQTGATDRIIVAGKADTGGGTSAFGVTRHLLADGALDNSFDTDGKATVALTALQDTAYGIKTQTDGKYVIAGLAGAPGTTENFGVARLSNDGSADTDFGSAGWVVSDTSGNNVEDGASAVVLGSIIAVGFELQTNKVVVAKYQDTLAEVKKFSWPTFLPAIITKPK